MKLVQGIKTFIYKIDFFYTSQLLRYKQEPEYRTLLGGFLSLSLIIGLLITFSNRVIDTLNKVMINTVTSDSNSADPLPFLLSTKQGSKFMFGVQIWHHNLSNYTRYFDVIMTNKQFITGEPQNTSLQYPLQPCQHSHWNDFPQIVAQFERLRMYQWLCLPKDSQFNIQGKYASRKSMTLQISVRKCNNNSNLTGVCATQQEIDAYFQQKGNFFFSIYFTNPLINPGQKEYLTYYLEDNNYIIFTNKFGAQGILFVQEYGLTTDESILPLTAVKEEKGGVVNQLALKNPYQINDNDTVYCSFSFFKSGIISTHERSFQKIDEVLSYIGGLFGTITILLVLINVYNGYSFEITLGGYLYRATDSLERIFRKYNFFSFLAHLAYSLLDLFGCSPNWTNAALYFKCRQEMVKQLDILYLIKRVGLLERSIQVLLDDHQLKALILQNRLTLDEARDNRLKYKIRDNAIRQCMKLKKNIDYQKDQRQITNSLMLKPKPKFQNIRNINFFTENQFNHENNIDNSDKVKNNQVQSVQKYKNNIKDIFSSESSQNQQQNLQIKQGLVLLRQQANKGNKLSQKLWQGLDQQLKEILSNSNSEQQQQNINCLTRNKIQQKNVQNLGQLKSIKIRQNLKKQNQSKNDYKQKKRQNQSSQKLQNNFDQYHYNLNENHQKWKKQNQVQNGQYQNSQIIFPQQ